MTARFSVLSLDAAQPECLAKALAQLPATTSLAIACGNNREIRLLAGINHTQLPLVAFSSCLTSTSNTDVGRADQQHLQVLLVDDPTGAYGIASAKLDAANLSAQVAELLQTATVQANRQGQQPALIWCLQPPGYEEQLLTALSTNTGPHVPVIGGSSADDDINGQWCQFDGVQLDRDLLVLIVLYPSCPISWFFSSGYHQLNLQATVTKAAARRIYQLDHKPALHVYNNWLDKLGLPALSGDKILAQSALVPLGRVISSQPVPLYLLSHPAETYADGSIALMSEVTEGEQLYLMMGSEDALVRRAGHVVRVAADTLKLRYQAVPAAAVVFYCAGCMLQVRNRYHEIHQYVRDQLGDLPFLIAYTFGEQGCFADGSNRHGNLMISALLFGTEPHVSAI